MKKVVRTIAAVAALFAMTTVMANEPKLETDGNSKNIVFEWEAHLVETSLKISDQNGNIIYTDYLTNVEAYVKKFDLSSLPQGTYFLKAENSMKQVVYTIGINKSDVAIIEKEEMLKPVYREEGSLVFLSLLNLDKEAIRVAVYDSFGRTLFKETFEDKLSVERAFNFENAFKGEYTIVVKKDKKTYNKTIEVK